MNNQAFDSVKQLDAEAIRLHARNAKAMAERDAAGSSACRQAIIINRGSRAAMHQRVMKECGALSLIAMRAKEASKRERLRYLDEWPWPEPKFDALMVPGLMFLGDTPSGEIYAYDADAPDRPPAITTFGSAAPGAESRTPNRLPVTERKPSRREQVVKIQAEALAAKYMLTDEQAMAVEAFGLAMAGVHPHG